MSAQPTHQGRPPEVDEGDPPGLLAFLDRELRPSPGRFGDSLRIVIVVLIVVAIGETFRLPDIAVSAYIVIFLSRPEAVSTVQTALVMGIVAVLAIFAAIGIFMLSLSEPALRIPLMAVAGFGAGFFARASALGPIFLAGGFIISYGLTMGDELLGIAAQPVTGGNAPQLELPGIVFISPEEALVHTLLWLTLAVALPVALLIAANLLTGRDPARILRDALAERLAAAARFCAGEKRAERRLDAQAFAGTATLRKLHDLAGRLRHARRRRADSATLISDINRLGLLLLAWLRVEGASRDALAPAAGFCRAAERALQTGESPGARPAPITATGAAGPLADWISRTLDAIADTLAAPRAAASPKSGSGEPSSRRLLAADAFTNPIYARFAFKLSLAVMLCYFIEQMTDWPGIHTCVITCFMVALGTIGETLHKATARIVGCLFGAALGLAAILLLMPLMTDLGQLLLLLAPVIFLSAWIGSGSDRTAYVGLQIGLAFCLVVLHGTAPTIDMYAAKDRVIGILLGNIVIFVIFTTLWPESVASAVRANVAKALEQLGSLVRPGAGANDVRLPVARSEAAMALGHAIGQARALLVNERFEATLARGDRPWRIEATVVAQIGRLFIPVSVLLDLHDLPAERDLPQPMRDAIRVHDEALARWFRQAASWVRSGDGAATVASGLPEPPIQSGAGDPLTAWAVWYGILHHDIRQILVEVGALAEPSIATPMAGTLHAAG
jgi:multidrug resistance protein MdtO